jgi:hypothetical protein
VTPDGTRARLLATSPRGRSKKVPPTGFCIGFSIGGIKESRKQADSGAAQLVEYGDGDGEKRGDRGKPKYDSRQTGRNEITDVL